MSNAELPVEGVKSDDDFEGEEDGAGEEEDEDEANYNAYVLDEDSDDENGDPLTRMAHYERLLKSHNRRIKAKKALASTKKTAAKPKELGHVVATIDGDHASSSSSTPARPPAAPSKRQVTTKKDAIIQQVKVDAEQAMRRFKERMMKVPQGKDTIAYEVELKSALNELQSAARDALKNLGTDQLLKGLKQFQFYTHPDKHEEKNKLLATRAFQALDAVMDVLKTLSYDAAAREHPDNAAEAELAARRAREVAKREAAAYWNRTWKKHRATRQDVKRANLKVERWRNSQIASSRDPELIARAVTAMLRQMAIELAWWEWSNWAAEDMPQLASVEAIDALAFQSTGSKYERLLQEARVSGNEAEERMLRKVMAKEEEHASKRGDTLRRWLHEKRTKAKSVRPQLVRPDERDNGSDNDEEMDDAESARRAERELEARKYASAKKAMRDYEELRSNGKPVNSSSERAYAEAREEVERIEKARRERDTYTTQAFKEGNEQEPELPPEKEVFALCQLSKEQREDAKRARKPSMNASEWRKLLTCLRASIRGTLNEDALKQRCMRSPALLQQLRDFCTGSRRISDLPSWVHDELSDVFGDLGSSDIEDD